MPGVRADAVLQLLEALEVLGHDPSQILRESGVGTDAVGDPDAWVAPDVVETLLRAAEQISHDPLVGLHAGMVPVDHGWLAYVGMTEGTVEGSLSRYATDVSLVASGVRFSFTVGADLACFQIAIDLPTSALAGPVRQALEYITAQTVNRYRRWARGFRPREVRFPHAVGGPQAEYERVLGAPARFGQKVLEIDIPLEALRLPLQTANPRVAAALEDEAQERRTTAELSTAVDQALRALLTRGEEVSLRGLARSMGVGERTLQRRLRESALSYRGILDLVRREIAADQLARTDLAVAVVSDRLGFSDTTAFGKAFHRWFAMSPTEFRRSRPPG